MDMRVSRRRAFSPAGDDNVRIRMLSELKGEMISVWQDREFFPELKER